MNKYQLYSLGGALLAATSLSGTAFAGTVGTFHGTTFTSGSIKVNNAAFSTTATTANAVQFGYAGGTNANIAMSFTNTYDGTFNLNITVPVTGATFSGAPTVHYILRDQGGSYSSTVTAGKQMVSGVTVSALADKLFISNVQITGAASVGNGTNTAAIGGIVLNSVTFANASGLATAGGTISLAGTVISQTNTNPTYETIAATAAVTSQAPFTTTISGSSATVAVGTAPSQFTTFASSNLSLTLATVAITPTGTVGTDLSLAIDVDGNVAGSPAAGSGSVSVTISSATLTDPAVTSLKVTTSGQGPQKLSSTTLTQFTPAIFSGGTVTFTLTEAANSYGSTFNVLLTYDGSTAISAATTAGTVTAVLASGSSSVVSPGSGSGSAATISRGGLSTEVSWANAGSGTGFTSYVRIHNKGTAAAKAVIVVTKDTTDGSAISTLGTVTTDTVASGGTIQVGVPAIESSLSINSATAGGSYTLRITGGFPGYVQHLSYNGSSLFDLSGFRNGSDGTSSAP